MHVRVEQHGGTAAIGLAGNVTRNDGRELVTLFRTLAKRHRLRAVAVDFADVERLDSAGALAITFGCRALADAGKGCELLHLSDLHRAALEMFESAPATPELPSRHGSVERFGERARGAMLAILQMIDLVGRTVRAIVRGLFGRQRLEIGRTVEQAVVIGVDALPIVALLGALIGVILSFQSGYQLQKFGAEVYMAEIVGLGMAREFGAVITAVILAGRSGAAITAELGTMRVNDEIDAIESMGIDPVGLLVVPRVVGLTLVQPLLSLMSTAVGIAAGIGVSYVIGIAPRAVFYRMQEALVIDDFALGLVKSVLFAWIITFTSCFMGLRTSGGAHGVGISTTRAVVASIVLVILVDSMVTTVWTVTHVQ
jgi:phospholipid/cholesterol/gamma-HCH transport system permease protein